MDRIGMSFSRTRRNHTVWLLIICVLSIVQLSYSAPSNDTNDPWSGFSSSCTYTDTKNVSVSCYGVRIVRKIVQQLLEKSTKEPSVEIFDGVSLVDVPGGSSARRARLLKGFGTVGPLLQFLEGRELRIKLPNLLPRNIETALQESLPVGQARKGGYGGGYGGGGGGKKGEGGGYMILALMMGKMMAAMGFGALGLLAMKALMVSAMALMLSMIVAVKKLAGGGDDGGGHHVVYAQEVGHHHRRRRSLNEQGDLTELPYRGYTQIYGDSQAAR